MFQSMDNIEATAIDDAQAARIGTILTLF